MSVILSVAKDEWRYWNRSKLAISIIIIAAFMTIASVIVTSESVNEAYEVREHLQEHADKAFVEQPDRHPHRMVHYGHYVFRTPPPLGAIDPGVDAYTGTSIFLEGHRQNTAMFAEQRQSNGLTRFSNLTPAFVMQVIVPLLLILVGYGVISRERESGTLTFIVAQGVSARLVLLGKFFALLLAGILVILPLVAACILAVLQGESVLAVSVFLGVHLFYIIVWCSIILIISAYSQKNSTSFVTLISLWVLLCLLIPRIASSTASAIVASPSKLEADFDVLQELRKLGDGHNASDPAFTQLKKSLLVQYGVDTLEALPVNFRGVVAQASEKELTEVLNQFAEKRMQEELMQAQIARQFGWLTPTLALRTLSMLLAGTNLETHHRFLREAENIRFEFVQGLNKVQAEILSYTDDVNRSQSQENAQKARVDASHWQLLENFTFTPSDASLRINNSLSPLMQLLCWMVALFFMLAKTRRALQ
ncbi:MAG: DUF3526 domain-containing protein [Pseudomonadota bacterium]